jgi:AraC family transcriptional activator of pobA
LGSLKTIPFHKNLSQNELKEEVKFHRLKSLNDYDTSLPHRHGYFELFFFEQGSGSHLIDYKKIDIMANTVHIVCPGQVHQLQLKSMSKGCFLTFSEAYLLEHLSAPIFQSLSYLQAYTEPSVLQLSNEEFSEYLDFTTKIENEPAPNLAIAWLNLILQKLKIAFENKSNFYLLTAKDETLIHFKTLLEKHFTEEHLPRFYAEQLAVTEKTLNRKIKEVHNITATEAIVNRILLEAKRLLINSHLSIKEIAFDLGFNDPAYFSRFIKKHTTKSPKEWKEEG